MSSPFSELIQKALFQQGDQRAQAENELVNQKTNDYKNYLIECVKIVVDKSYAGDLRQAAGTLIKASASQNDNTGKVNWDKVDEGIQSHAKNALLQTLIDADPLARKAAADAISTICSIELPRNKWTDLIQSLSENSSNQDLNIRKTAIMTMGYICEKLKDSQSVGNAFQLQDTVLEHILMGIINGMKADQTDVGIKTTSIQALRNALGYLEIYLNKQEVREFVLTQIIQCTSHEDDDIKAESLQTLIEFCRFQYNNLQNYVQQIFNQVSNHISSKNETICIPAIEIWNTLATEYRDRIERNGQMKVQQQQEFNFNYCEIIREPLVQHLLQNLLVKSDNDDENESSIQITSQEALNAIVEALGDSVVDTFTTFISNTASHQDWVYKQASCMAFGCILECGNDEKMQNMLFSALNVFVNMLKENNLFLVQTAAKFLAKAAEHHPQVFLKHPNLQQDLSTIITTLQQKPEISRHICWVICFLSEALKTNMDSPLNMSLTQVIEELMKNALRNDLPNKDMSLIDCSFMGIMTLLHNSPQTNVSAQYLKHAIEHFKQSYNEPMPKREKVQCGILATMHASLLSIQEELGNDQGQDTQIMIQTIYDLIMQHFQSKSDVDSDGLYVISALATCIKGNFVKYLDGVWAYLQHALQKQIDGDLFKTAIGALADIARACDSHFVKHVDVIETLIKCVQLPEFDRELKLHVYVCLGDVILACKEASGKYLNELGQTFQLGFSATIFMIQSGKANDMEYAENLQEKLVEAFTCMLHGINNNEQVDERLIGQFQNLIDFLQFTCDAKHNPTIDYVRNSLTLIIDIANYYGKSVSGLVKTPFTLQLIQILEKFNHIPENSQILQYAHKIYNNI